MAGLGISESLLYVGIAFMVFNHTVMQHFLLKRLRDHHAEIWQRMGRPTVFGGSESHWTLAGYFGDFAICRELGTDETSRVTRYKIYRYRVLFAVEAVLLATAMVAILTGR